MSKDESWEKMVREYLARVPRPVFREDPPVKTRLEEQFKTEDHEASDEQQQQQED